MKWLKVIIYLLAYLLVMMANTANDNHLQYVLLILMIVLFLTDEILLKKSEKEQLIENKQLQEMIKSSSKDAHLKNKQLITMVANIPFPMMLVDVHGNIVMHNDLTLISNKDSHVGYISYLKNDLEEVVQEFVKDAFILEKDIDKMINIHDIEYQALHIPILAKEKYSGCLFLFQDISKAMEKEKMQKRFIADASHELKTPISVIKGMVEILNRDDFNDEETQKEFLYQIEQEVNRIDILVKDLLVLSRLSKSNLALEYSECDVNAMLLRCVNSLEKTAQQKQLTIETNLQVNRFIRCDYKKMEQVFINLLSNAIKYSDQGVIKVSAISNDKQVLISFEDQGVGIRKENLHRIFERFYREDEARSRLSGGSGLGLSIVKSIIDAHKFKIKVESEVKKGSKFTIIINSKK